jgi:hypothetical protein
MTLADIPQGEGIFQYIPLFKNETNSRKIIWDKYMKTGRKKEKTVKKTRRKITRKKN